MEIDTRIREVRPEALDAVTLTLDLQGSRFPHQPGQFIEIHPRQFRDLEESMASLEGRKGVPEGPRGFSICSYETNRDSIEISVKEDPGGRYPALLSPWLVRKAQPGQHVRIVGPFGKYCLPEGPPTGITGYLHLCAGSGVAPNRAMIGYALNQNWPQRHLLILQNRTARDIFYCEQWSDWAEKFPDRFRVRHVLSSDGREHISVELVRVLMERFLIPECSIAMVCGPNRPRQVTDHAGQTVRLEGFCDQWRGVPRRGVRGLLADLGFSDGQVRSEMW